jgi:intracellular sulfur oxidation DsrE/DsrF family protein
MSDTICRSRLRPAPFAAALAVAFLLVGLLAARSGFAGDAPVPSFPNIPDIPVPHGVGYGGYFKHHKPVRIVFGVADPGKALNETLTNAAYTIQYLAPRHIKYRIQIVLYSNAVKAADVFSNTYAGYGPLIRALHAHGVQFRICNNSLHSVGVSPGDLYGFMKIIPAGILQIAKKQMQGYAYINNSPR